jgi:hypothetical protein
VDGVTLLVTSVLMLLVLPLISPFTLGESALVRQHKAKLWDSFYFFGIMDGRYQPVADVSETPHSLLAVLYSGAMIPIIY